MTLIKKIIKKTSLKYVEKIQKKKSKDDQIVQLLKFLIQLTTVDETFIKGGSNGLNLLVGLKYDLTNHCFQNIQIKNSCLIGRNFASFDLSGSKFENVDISEVNLNGTLLLNCKWKNIKIHELHQLQGHTDCVFSVCFSPDRTKMASGGGKKNIRRWRLFNTSMGCQDRIIKHQNRWSS
ncbi:unnamed protein product [Paramecium sonneborni]|uniref:Pentapeptide repeat-containing protein n=1 Tax=Paramecium sonneborni TaxID=65129 RepID=A0A8S1RPD0_9CILI|nr:unnamed protein product [Paramecium sonneborni]